MTPSEVAMPGDLFRRTIDGMMLLNPSGFSHA
jgi:hypothetical protein